MTNANKVKVSKEVAEAIEQLRKSRSDKDIFYHATCLVLFLDKFKRANKSAIRTLHGIDPLKLATALTVGYEIEQDPAETVAEHYRNLSELFTKFGYECDLAAMEGIKFVVKAYGLKIEGVDVK